MLNLSQHFFDTEVREGFTVDSTMKTFWAAEMEVLREVSEVCERHGIQWYPAYGTLLGAVRHQGYIPWDDDMDIWMFREDYNKFMKVAPLELPEEYIVRSALTEKGYTQFHSCVFNAESISIEQSRLQKFHGCPFAAGIDIFPLDYLPDDKGEREMEKELFNLIWMVIDKIKGKERDKEDIESLFLGLDAVEEMCGVTFHREWLDTEKQDNLVSDLYKLQNQLSGSYGKEDGHIVTVFSGFANYADRIFEETWFENVKLVPFEEIMIPIPTEYDNILRTIYGNYEIRQKFDSAHDYPLYKKQVEALKDFVGNLEEKYVRVQQLISEARQKEFERREKC